MRHRKKFNHLGRKAQHRKLMLSNMASSLIIKKRIFTTTAKAKALRVFVEPLITKSKEDSTHSRRTVFSYLQNKYAVSELFREVSQKVASRPGGYTRILKTGFRKGDGAEMCFIELVDYNTNMMKTTDESTTKKTRRSRRGRKSATAQPNDATAKTGVKEQKTEDSKETEEVKKDETTQTLTKDTPEVNQTPADNTQAKQEDANEVKDSNEHAEKKEKPGDEKEMKTSDLKEEKNVKKESEEKKDDDK